MPINSVTSLDKLSKSVLKLYATHQYNHYTLHDLAIKLDSDSMTLARPVLYIMQQGYLEIEPSYAMKHKEEISLLGDSIAQDTPLRLTQVGQAILEEHNRNRLIFRLTEFRAWATLAISLVALILSIIALIIE